MIIETLKMVTALCELESELTEWEVNFVEDISHRNYLTEKQVEKLNKLYKKYLIGR